MTARDIVLEQIQHHSTRPIPYTLRFEESVAERLDQHFGSPSWRERIIPYVVSVGGITRRQLDPISDSVSRDWFGSLWRTDERPFHLVEPVLKDASLDGYDLPSVEPFEGRNLSKSAAKVMRENPDSFTTIDLSWGLWESCRSIRGFENALMDSVAEPDFFAELLRRLTDLYLAQVAQCADIPGDAIMFGDDWGDQRGVMIGPDRWREALKPHYAQIYEAVHAQDKLVITHCCGSVVDIMPDIIEIGLDVLESVQPEARGMNPYELKRRWGDKITFWGGLGSQSTIPFGTPAEIHEEVRRLRREMSKGGGYILAPAKPLQPGTPTENAVAVVEALTNQE